LNEKDSDDSRTYFNSFVQKFLEIPTTENRDRLILASDKYRDEWILTMASGNRNDNVPDPRSWSPEAIAKFYSEQLSKTSTSTKYSKKLEAVRVLKNGLPIKLILQRRSSVREKNPYWTLSWRTKYTPSGTNRRFYYSSGNYWNCPAITALELFDDLEKQGGLSENYFDVRPGSSKVKILTDNKTRIEAPHLYQKQCREIFAPNENWGEFPELVILTDPNADWKKVMVLDKENLVCTFRSLTKNTSYMPKKDLAKGSKWWLDNAMMDANVQQMRIFHRKLREILASVS